MQRSIDGRRGFPNLVHRNNSITSEPDDAYNCIGWAADPMDNLRWWSPIQQPQPRVFWPEGVSRGRGIESFVDALKTVGYIECVKADIEDGFEKIAIFEKYGKFTHVARQLRNGKWTSKLGEDEDIQHNKLDSVGGGDYGKPVKFMRRPYGRNNTEDRGGDGDEKKRQIALHVFEKDCIWSP